MDISPLHALQLWFAGAVPKDVTVWGHQLIFWDRLGQVMEFVGALAVLVDLLGADRLATIAVELRQWTRDPELRPSRLLARPRSVLFGIVTIAIVAGFVMLTGSRSVAPVLPFTTVPVAPALAFVVTILVLALATYLLLALYFAAFGVVIPPLAAFIARLLQREHADKWLKLFSLPLLTLGFLLDLLVS